MNFTEVFIYCPTCKEKLTAQTKALFICPNGDFYFHVNPAPCNSIILTNEAGEILLVKRKYEPKKDCWDLPGGFVEWDENLEESIVREIKEELNLELKKYSYFASFSDLYLYKGINYHTIGFVFTGKLEGETLDALDDVEEIKFFTPDKLPFGTIAFRSIEQALREYLQSLPSSQ